MARLVDVFQNPSLKLVSLTITEKGYVIKDSSGKLLTQVAEDLRTTISFENLQHTMSKLTYLLLKRFLVGAAPLAVLSTDNFSHNGDRLKATVLKLWWCCVLQAMSHKTLSTILQRVIKSVFHFR